MSEKCGILGDESEADGRNCNQGSRDGNNKERFNQDKDESTSDSCDGKKHEEKLTDINSKVIVSQELECDGGKRC